MDKHSYARYLLQLMDEEKSAEESDIDEAQFYGYFQMYMPDGKSVAVTFEPLEDGHVHLQRILQINAGIVKEVSLRNTFNNAFFFK